MNYPAIHTYTLLIRPCGGAGEADGRGRAFHVEAAAVPDCRGVGDTIEEAVTRGYEALVSRLEAIRERGELLPDEEQEGCRDAVMMRVNVPEPLPVIR